MQQYVIEITNDTLPLITLLNQGVTPEIEDKITFFVIDAEWNSDVPNKIVFGEAIKNYEYARHIPVYHVK